MREPTAADLLRVNSGVCIVPSLQLLCMVWVFAIDFTSKFSLMRYVFIKITNWHILQWFLVRLVIPYNRAWPETTPDIRSGRISGFKQLFTSINNTHANTCVFEETPLLPRWIRPTNHAVAYYSSLETVLLFTRPTIIFPHLKGGN